MYNVLNTDIKTHLWLNILGHNIAGVSGGSENKNKAIITVIS